MVETRRMNIRRKAVEQSEVEPLRVKEALDLVARSTGYSYDQLHQAFRIVNRIGAFSHKTIISRMNWLLSLAKTGSVNSFSPEKLAASTLNPQNDIFDSIVESGKTPLSRENLLEIYNYARQDEKLDQMSDFPDERILREMHWLTKLDLPLYYYQTTSCKDIAAHLTMNRSEEVRSELQNIQAEDSEDFVIRQKTKDANIYITGISGSQAVEKEILQKSSEKLAVVSVYYTKVGKILYIVKTGDDLGSVAQGQAHPDYLASSPQDKVERYQRLYEKFLQCQKSGESLVTDFSDKEETGEQRLMLAWLQKNDPFFPIKVSRLLGKYNLELTRKYFHSFGGSNPVRVSSIYFKLKGSVDYLKLGRDLNALMILPQGELARLYESGQVGIDEALFTNCLVNFIHQFISEPNESVSALSESLGSADQETYSLLSAVQRIIDKNEFQHAIIGQTFIKHPKIRNLFFRLFNSRFNPERGTSGKSDALIIEINEAIESCKLIDVEKKIFKYAFVFLDNILRTNFYIDKKSALSFRLKSDFLTSCGFTRIPYGIFFVNGSNFRGYHNRFRKIARGGVRIVSSASEDEYSRNSDSNYEEVYNLSWTQQLKNKDIAEGGSKGIVLLDCGTSRGDGVLAFKKYIDSILDLILPGKHNGIKNFEEEILFFGPDEGSADLMDWTCERARDRGYAYWKGVTTGKSAFLGGISHIDYGMTTIGVHQYVLELLARLGISEEMITKVQTGGPDGDLGSNEILLSRDRTLALVDGGGVIYDPLGLDRVELRRLAARRIDSSHFARERLSPQGFKITVGDENIKLPDGTFVKNGLNFRNSFHLNERMKADLFVPCGGRPRSINLNNWKKLIDENGQPLFKYIVEGANLFITPEARVKLEEKGVILIPDSSANKGGVTSSAYEVLAGLALTDEEYLCNMTVRDNEPAPEFRICYINEILKKIKDNARLEFATIWTEHCKTGGFLSRISDLLSEKINSITDSLSSSDLFDDEKIRMKILENYVPDVLMRKIGFNEFQRRVPESYQRAIFAKELARKFVYRHGVNPGYEEYRQYLKEMAGDNMV